MENTLRFGVATADHQCEAYDGNDDIRDVWERTHHLTPRGRATDFWNRYREDVDLAKNLGCSAFRLSLSWSRLEPTQGHYDDAAFAHYRDVLHYMRDAGMMTVVTLHHNTWPLHVQAAGDGAGMLDPGFPTRMGAYASQVAQRLGDLIDRYVTLNEPNQLVYGFIKGFWMRDYAMPPGLDPYATSEQQMDAVVQLIPNLFRAHARARAAILAVHPEAKTGANPLVLGLPPMLRRWVDRNATRVKSPADAKRQAARLAQTPLIDRGLVDISISQLTMTPKRADHVLFSEPYFIAHFAALHLASTALPEDFSLWKGRVGVVEQTPPAAHAAGAFPDAAVSFYADAQSAVDALRRGDVDIVYHDDVLLRQFADGLTLTELGGPAQPFAVAMALGSRCLLDAVNAVVRDVNGAPATGAPDARECEQDASLKAIRRRGELRVGVHPGVKDLCVPDGEGGYLGLEAEIAQRVARAIFGTPDAKVRFVPLAGAQRIRATRSFLHVFDNLRKSIAMFGTLLGTNWWNLGMAGKLPPFLCPCECVGTLDYVGLDYYWGIPSYLPRQLERLAAAAQCRYANAPVWPNALDYILQEAQEHFPDKPIIIVENGCVASADGYSRAEYLRAHLAQVERALRAGAPIEAYLCWSITSNREWGLPFDDNSDFGLYHVDLDTDPELVRLPTEASACYAEIIAAHRASER